MHRRTRCAQPPPPPPIGENSGNPKIFAYSYDTTVPYDTVKVENRLKTEELVAVTNQLLSTYNIYFGNATSKHARQVEKLFHCGV